MLTWFRNSRNPVTGLFQRWQQSNYDEAVVGFAGLAVDGFLLAPSTNRASFDGHLHGLRSQELILTREYPDPLNKSLSTVFLAYPFALRDVECAPAGDPMWFLSAFFIELPRRQPEREPERG